MADNKKETKDMRVDQWLHAARFFKTRALAGTALRTGRVLVNGARVKPAKNLHVGDTLSIRRGDEALTVTVAQLARRRVAAKIAATYYEETADSLAARTAAAERRRFAKYHAPSPGRRPDKRSRRRLIRLGRGDD